MAREREVRVKIVGEDNASPAFKKAGNSLDSLGPAGDRASGALGKVQNALSTFGGTVGKKLSGGIDSIVSSLSNMGPAATAGTAVAATAVAGLGVAAVKGIQNFVEMAGKVRDFGRAAGTTAEESSQFVSALDDMGISAEAGSSALFKLGKNAATNADALGQLGIEVGHTKDGSTDLKETFLNVADAFSRTSDPAKRAEIAMAAFGKAGANLIPILEKGRDGIEELFSGADLAFSQKDLDAAEDFRLAMDHLGDSTAKLEREIGGGLVPVIADMVDAAATGADKLNDLAKPVGGLGGAFDKLTRLLPGIGQVRGLLDAFGGSSKDASIAQGEMEGAVDGATTAIDEQVQALEDEKKALDDANTAAFNAVSSQIAYRDSINNVEDATATVAEKQKAYTDAVRAHTANSPEARAALEDLTRAQDGQEASIIRAAEAAGKYAEAEAATHPGMDATKAKFDAQIATLQGLVAQTTGPTHDAIVKLITDLSNIRDKNVAINVRTEKAIQDINGLKGYMDRVLGNTVAVSPPPLKNKAALNRIVGPVAGLAEGGIVRARPGGTLVNVGEGGSDEAVIPLGDGSAVALRSHGGGEVHNHFHFPNFVGNENDLMRAIEASVTRKARNGDPLWAPLAPGR